MLPEAELGEIEMAVLHYPEIKAAVNSLQHDKEKFVMLYATPPPPGIKDRLLEIIQQENTQEGNDLLPEELRTPVPTPAKETPVKKLPAAKKSTDRIWKYATAAIVALLFGSVIMNFFFFNRSTDYKSRYRSLIAAQEKLDAQKEQHALTSIKEPTKEPDLLTDPAFKWMKMDGVGAFTGNSVSVGWNPQTQVVYLLAQLMPVPPAGKQFQLWAIVNKKLVDAGVFDGGAEVSQKLQQMKAIAIAQGFAVTLERKGGSTSPTMSQICMSAKVTR
ncbi:anti-sigma factor [Chitinophaga niastensis]|nr:anti-sigma factor [Chitinophaga niastensis]